VEVAVNRGFAVAAVRGDRPWGSPEAVDDAGDGGREHGRIGRVADVQVVVQHDAVDVVEDLCLVAELDGTTETPLGDRARVGVVQRHDPGRPIGGVTGDPAAGLGGDPLDQLGGALEIGQQYQGLDGGGVDVAAQASPRVERDMTARTARAAMATISALIACTSALASSPRRRSHAPMSWARRRIERVRSRKVVRDARPVAWIAAASLASFATPLASSPESVG
jgi:hypothetical protein